MKRTFGTTVVGLIGAASLVGCNSAAQLPEKPAIDVDVAVDKAFQQLDSDSSGGLDLKELRSAPGMLFGLDRVDANKDRTISRDELAQRLAFWNESTQRVFNLEVALTYRGRPVSQADVTFEPEPFLAEWLKPVTGRTDDLGRVTPRASEDFPGIDKGYYRVKVSGGSPSLPPKFSEDSPAGIEFTDDRPEDEQFLLQLRLDAPPRR
ncbi:MAG: hypothetical protein KDA44_09875 [Planctomycetales bacterium]|nr:hypothetical protein [Planctomycetales bacterium]